MDFGTGIGGANPGSSKSPYQQIEDAGAVLRTMSKIGYTHVMTAEHWLAHPIYTPLTPMPMLARMAPETGNMKLVTYIIQMPLHNPVDIAEQVSTIDHISNGRFVLGLGNGYRLAELEAAGVTRKERAPRVEESIEIMKRLWAGEDLDFKGRFWNVKGRMALTPVQKGGPPVWIAVHADGAAQRGARLADGVLIGPQIYLDDVAKLSAVYQEECAKIGRPRGTIGISRRLAVIRNEKDRADVMTALKASAEHSIKMYGTWDMQEKGMVDIRLNNATNIHNEYTILGSPEECVEQINRYKEATNMDLFQFNLVNSLPDVKAREEAMQFVWEEILSKVK